MELERLHTQQMEEIERWASSIDKVILPSDLVPETLHDYPHCREIADKMRRLCISKRKELDKEITAITDAFMEEIEADRIPLKVVHGIVTQVKKTYPSADARERELRKRLAAHPTYEALVKERDDWDHMSLDWRAYGDKLRQEMRLLEADYLHNGGNTIQVSKQFK